MNNDNSLVLVVAVLGLGVLALVYFKQKARPVQMSAADQIGYGTGQQLAGLFRLFS